MFLAEKSNKKLILDYYKNKKSRDKSIELICPQCNKRFIISKIEIQRAFSDYFFQL